MPLLELAAREVAASIHFELVENYQVQIEPVPVPKKILENFEIISREFLENSVEFRENSEIILREFQENSERILTELKEF